MRLILSLLAAAAVSSLISGYFINSLNYFIAFFQEHWEIMIWATPIAGLLLAWSYHWKYFRNCEAETSPMLAPFIFLTSCWSHLFGASVGREGAAAQIGSSISEFIRRRDHHEEHRRNLFAHVGAAAAFAAAIGTPWSAISFAMEYKRKPNLENFLASAGAAGIGYWITGLIHVHHWIPPTVSFEWSQLAATPTLLITLLLFAGTAAYFFLEKGVGHFLKKWPKWIPLLASGSVLTIATVLVGSAHFNNLGVDLLNASFFETAQWKDFFGKFFFTFVSIAGGWKGGSFTPLMACGSLLGSASAWLVGGGVSSGVGAALGLFCFVNKKFHIPFTSIILTGELLGWRLGLLSIPLHLLIRLLRSNHAP
jgi:H+/Cl- antiporter ClcA